MSASAHRQLKSTDQQTEPHWYAAYTCANHEKKAAAELQSRSVEHFLPLYASVRRWQDRRVKLELPLFPGYVFVRLPIQERLRVLQVPGVVQLVSFGSTAAQVPDADIERIRRILQSGIPSEPLPYLAVGNRVRVNAGPLLGLEGIITRRKNGVRFVVTVEMIQRSVAVELSGMELETLPQQGVRKTLEAIHG